MPLTFPDPGKATHCVANCCVRSGFDPSRLASAQGARPPTYLLPASLAIVRTPASVIAFLVLAAVTAPDALAATKSEHQLWASTTLFTRPLTSWRLLGWLDLHDRKRQDSTLLIMRPALGYQVLDRLAVHAGYAWIPTYVDEGADRHEQRIWQQLLFNAPAPAGWSLSLRPRFEQRFADGGNDTGYRMRLWARASYALNAGVLFVLWNELFYQFNDTDWKAAAGFDQNRAFLGVGLPAVSGARVEFGYLQVFTKRTPDSHMDHNLAINLFWTY